MSIHPPGSFVAWQVKMSELEQELAVEQVTHPLDLYQPGSERLEKLYEAMATAQRFSWPLEGYTVNL